MIGEIRVLTGARVELAFDLVDRDVARPTMFDGGSRVPEAGFGLAELLNIGYVVVPRQL